MAGAYCELDLEKLVIFPNELEKVPRFRNLTDFCQSFSLKKGKKFKGKKEADDSSDDEAGEMKASICVYRLANDPGDKAPEPFFLESVLPSTAPVDCVCRLYLLEAVDLQPTDANGLADPFVEIQVGSRTFNNRSEYVPNNLNPVFGK